MLKFYLQCLTLPTNYKYVILFDLLRHDIFFIFLLLNLWVFFFFLSLLRDPVPSDLKGVITFGATSTWFQQKSLKTWRQAWVWLDLKLSMRATQSSRRGEQFNTHTNMQEMYTDTHKYTSSGQCCSSLAHQPGSPLPPWLSIRSLCLLEDKLIGWGGACVCQRSCQSCGLNHLQLSRSKNSHCYKIIIFQIIQTN